MYFWSKSWHFMIKCDILVGFIMAIHFASFCLCDFFVSYYVEIQDFPLTWLWKTVSLFVFAVCAWLLCFAFASLYNYPHWEDSVSLGDLSLLLKLFLCS